MERPTGPVETMIQENAVTEDSSSQHGVADETYVAERKNLILLSATRSKIPVLVMVREAIKTVDNKWREETYMCQTPWEKEVPSF